MDGYHFDALARSFSEGHSRRGLTRRLGSVALSGSLALLGLAETEARRKKGKKRKEHKPKPKFNQFGCVNVDRVCKHPGQCCSGICKGKKGKKTCRAHDSGACRPGQIESICGGTTVLCTTSAGEADGLCETTTGNAGYCVAGARCWPCSKDVDCQPFCGPQAACFRCAGFCAAEGGTACGGPGNCPGFPFPP